ncbi:MAG: hypothetical protein A3F17_00425 [Gammaproteobacteria bacterium RIFCSPHIGHO2_12_FULL_41_15]|nr:MAG: hypothetical protein A3F17_00425 [Gammaproteobacteria bacterium RIFCSPHIGHO2_12_FULL_41_15]
MQFPDGNDESDFLSDADGLSPLGFFSKLNLDESISNVLDKLFPIEEPAFAYFSEYDDSNGKKRKLLRDVSPVDREEEKQKSQYLSREGRLWKKQRVGELERKIEECYNASEKMRLEAASRKQAKKEKCRISAQRSRQRKKEKMKALEKQVEQYHDVVVPNLQEQLTKMQLDYADLKTQFMALNSQGLFATPVDRCASPSDFLAPFALRPVI